MLGLLTHLDGRLSEEVTDARWWPLTQLMELLSSWWVKGPLFVGVVLALELVHLGRLGRPRVPAQALAVLAAALLGSALSSLVKLLFDRPRPPLGDAGISAIGALPTSSSFPSGHATTAFAAAVAVSLLRPRLRPWALALAVGVALSRVYLGVHYVGDVCAGAALGAAIGVAVTLAARALTRPAPTPRLP